jgi:PAS domain S-box-containing protein
MTATAHAPPPPPTHRADKVLALALGLAHAEKRLQAVTSGQVDAIVDLDGNPYLLRPAQERLRRNEERLQTLLDSGSDLITVIDRGGLILSQTLAVRRMLGYGPGELVGQILFDFVHTDDQPHLYSAFHNVIGGFLTDTTVEFRHRTCDGSYRMLEATVSKLRDVSVASVVLTCRDTTRRRQAQEEATRREAELAAALLSKDHLLATLSHELRTPLTPALLGVQALEEDERFAEAKPTLAMIRRNIEIQARLLEALLDFNHIVHGKLQPKLESVDAEGAVQNALAICQSEIAAQQIAISLDFRAAEHHVCTGSTELQQILWILIKNAVKFSERGGSVEIASINTRPGSLTLRISDHGVGIEPTLLPLVFNSFQQGDRSMRQRYGGLGLGLFIAKGLAEAQGGILIAASEGRDKGATFNLTLKIAKPAEPPAKALAPPPPDLLRILLVEDHADTRVVLGRLLEQQGHIVFTAQDTASALRLAETCEAELLISDIGLPDGTGYELMERLRLARPSLAGIALSGFGMPSDREQSREAGFAEHLVKPVNIESLQSAVQGSHPKPKILKTGNLSPRPVISEKKTTHPPPGKPADGERHSQ